MPVIPALHVEYCTKCHHSLSIPQYHPLYPTDGSERAFSFAEPSFKSDELIARAKASLVSVEETHNSLQKSLEQLEEHRRRLRIYLHRQQEYNSPSPIRHLPTEVLSLIFSHACQSFEHDDYLTPLSISLTCFKWRCIALSTPSLWTNIFVGSVGTYPNGADILSLYLGRSRSLPISLKWETHRVDWFDSDGNAIAPFNPGYLELKKIHQNLTAKVWATCESWARADISLDRVDEGDFSRHLGHPTRFPLPYLDNVSLSTYYGGANCPDFTGARNLTTAQIRFRGGNYQDWAHGRFLWPGIDTFITDTWYPSMHQALPGFGFVEGNHKTLIIAGSINSGAPPPLTLTQCYVTRLIIRPLILSETLVDILSRLSLPGLEEFTLE